MIYNHGDREQKMRVNADDLTGRFIIVALWFSGLGVFAAPEASAAQRTIGQLTRRVVLPPWARPIPNNPPANRPWQPLGGARRSADAVRQSTRRLLHLANSKAGTPNHPFWLLKLGACFVDLDEDAVGYHYLGRILSLPPGTARSASLPGPRHTTETHRAAAVRNGPFCRGNR